MPLASPWPTSRHPPDARQQQQPTASASNAAKQDRDAVALSTLRPPEPAPPPLSPRATR